jgi:hypothetical protein
VPQVAGTVVVMQQELLMVAQVVVAQILEP